MKSYFTQSNIKYLKYEIPFCQFIFANIHYNVWRDWPNFEAIKSKPKRSRKGLTNQQQKPFCSVPHSSNFWHILLSFFPWGSAINFEHVRLCLTVHLIINQRKHFLPSSLNSFMSCALFGYLYFQLANRLTRIQCQI